MSAPDRVALAMVEARALRRAKAAWSALQSADTLDRLQCAEREWRKADAALRAARHVAELTV